LNGNRKADQRHRDLHRRDLVERAQKLFGSAARRQFILWDDERIGDMTRSGTAGDCLTIQAHWSDQRETTELIADLLNFAIEGL
jgi:hypothetical protein